MQHPTRRPRSSLLALAPFLLLLVPLGALSAQSGGNSAAPAAAADSGRTFLRLKTGAIAFGEILAHDPDGVRFRLLESGGEVELPWGYLDPAEADALRTRYGYVESDAEEVMIDADRVELVDGSEIIGRIVDRTDNDLLVKRADSTISIPKARVSGAITAVQAPALDIFTKDELFQQKAQELQGRLSQDGRAGAVANDELARYAEKLFDFAHALSRYQRVQQLDPTYESARIEKAIARAQEKTALQQQVDFLAEIQLMSARKLYAKATEKLGQFPSLFPNSPLLEDKNKLQERVAKAQERDLRDAIVSRWFFYAVRLAQAAARKQTFAEVQAYLDGKMSEDVAKHVRDDVQSIAAGIEVDQVKKLWAERKSGGFQSATYGFGTWLLGESARAELDKPKDKPKDPKAKNAKDDKNAKDKTPAPTTDPGKSTQEEERKKLEDRMKRYLENQKLTADAAKKGSKEDDPEAFWKGFDSASRSQWILAYYAEKSGDFRDLEPRFENCRECGGVGTREVLFTGSAASTDNQGAGDQLVPCPACHHIGVVRRIRYR